MGKVKDITGQKFGRLTAISFAYIKNNKAFWNCVCECGNECAVRGKDLRSGKTRSCGCLSTEKRIERIRKYNAEGHCGQNSPNWNPNLTDEERAENFAKWRDGRFRKWSYAVKERDSFTCQVCGDNRGGNLVSHHIWNWADHKDKRYDLDNGICMCKHCHKAFHGQFGYNHNDEAQLSEFVEMFDNGSI